MTDLSNQKERSRAYPVITLTEAFTRLVRLNDNLGINGRYNRETIANGMGYSSLNGKASRAVAALSHYGLLTRTKELYSFSALARKYLLPNDDNDQAAATRTAALAPALFAEIYQAFKGQIIPKQFANRLVNEFGIQPKAASDVERIFRSTMTSAGLMLPNNVLDDIDQGSSDMNEVAGMEKSQDAKNSGVDEPHNQKPKIADAEGHLTVRLPSGLMISYGQDLASAFAFGTFGDQLKALDDAIKKYLNGNKGAEDE